jgi:hypothetical protein
MVTYRQVGRGIACTMRAMDREAKRSARQRIAYEKAAQRQALLRASSNAAAEYDRMIGALTGSHRITFQRRDWLTTATAPELPPAERTDEHERTAQDRADAYEPGWFVRTFGMEGRRRAALENEIQRARRQDDAEFQARRSSVSVRNAEIDSARRVVAKDHAAIAEALDRHSALGNLPFAVEDIDILFTDDDRVIAMVDGLDLEDMPTQSVSLLQSGKASIKAIPKSKILELHRDNVCSAALRVALEFLQVLSLETVEVVMLTDLLDPATGHIDADPVLYLRVAAQALAPLNLGRTEAHALVERLGGHLDWSRRDGFRRLNLGPFAIPVDDSAEG